MFYVVAYDISDDRRRTRIARELETWGNRTQFSVFECDLNDIEYNEMVDVLRSMFADGDALRIYRLCQACESSALIIGGKDLSVDQDYYAA
jgi:CRISPR-associated protein Cas2